MIVVLQNIEIHQMDVKIIFLNGVLDEEIYMKQSEDFFAPGMDGKVWRLLYGLKQTPK